MLTRPTLFIVHSTYMHKSLNTSVKSQTIKPYLTQTGDRSAKAAVFKGKINIISDHYQ